MEKLTQEQRLEQIEDRLDTIFEILQELLEKINDISIAGADYSVEEL